MKSYPPPLRSKFKELLKSIDKEAPKSSVNPRLRNADIYIVHVRNDGL